MNEYLEQVYAVVSIDAVYIVNLSYKWQFHAAVINNVVIQSVQWRKFNSVWKHMNYWYNSKWTYAAKWIINFVL